MKPTPEDALGKLAMAHLLGALEETEDALYTAYAEEHPEAEAVLSEARKDLACVEAPPVAAPAGAWRKIQEQLRHKRAGSEPAQPLSPDDVILVSCSYCRDGLERGHTVYCASCLAPHHQDCFQEHGRCSVMGCGETQIVRATGHDASSAPEPVLRRPRRWRGRAGLGVFLLAGAGVAAYTSEGLGTQAQLGNVPLPTPAPVVLEQPEPTPATEPATDSASGLVSVEWRGATLGEALSAIREAQGQTPEALEGDWARALVADRPLCVATPRALLKDLSEELDLPLTADGTRVDVAAAAGKPVILAPRQQRYYGSYLIENDGAAITAAEVGTQAPLFTAVAAQGDLWAEVRSHRVRVYLKGRLLHEESVERYVVNGLAVAPTGNRVAWTTADGSYWVLALGPNGEVLRTSGRYPESAKAELCFDAFGTLLVTFGRGWVVEPTPTENDLARAGSWNGWHALETPHVKSPRFARVDGVRYVARPSGGWWLVVPEFDPSEFTVYAVGYDAPQRTWIDEGKLCTVHAPNAAGLEAVVDALRRRAFEDLAAGLPVASKQLRSTPLHALLAAALTDRATAGVYREPGGVYLSVQAAGETSRLLLAPEARAVSLVWQAPNVLSVLLQGAAGRTMALHTIRVSPDELRSTNVLHSEVDSVDRVLSFRDGRFLVGLSRVAEREAHAWGQPAPTRALPPVRRVSGSEAQFYNARSAKPAEVSRPVATTPQSTMSEDYRAAVAIVSERRYQDYPSAGRVLLGVARNSIHYADAQQQFAFLLAHGQLACETFYAKGQADSALLLGTQLAELAEGKPGAVELQDKIELWRSVLESFDAATESHDDDERAAASWREILRSETRYSNYYNEKARHALTRINERTKAAMAARAAEPAGKPKPAEPSVNLAHVKPGQRWVFRQGDTETEWEILRVEGDVVAYSETAHVSGRDAVPASTEKFWTPDDLNLGLAQGGGVETQGPQPLKVPGVSLSYTVRKVGNVEHWVAVGGIYGEPVFPGLVRNVRKGGVALELIRVDPPGD